MTSLHPYCVAKELATLKNCLLSVNAWLSCPSCQMAMLTDSEKATCVLSGSMV